MLNVDDKMRGNVHHRLVLAVAVAVRANLADGIQLIKLFLIGLHSGHQHNTSQCAVPPERYCQPNCALRLLELPTHPAAQVCNHRPTST